MNNPGRPVISSINSHITKYIDYKTQPFAKEVKSYILDTKDFLNKNYGIWTIPQVESPLTMDVRSLFSNIKYNEELLAFGGAEGHLNEGITKNIYHL